MKLQCATFLFHHRRHGLVRVRFVYTRKGTPLFVAVRVKGQTTKIGNAGGLYTACKTHAEAIVNRVDISATAKPTEQEKHRRRETRPVLGVVG